MCIQRAGRGRCEQQSLDGVVFQDQVTCLDCTLMKNRSAMGLQRLIELSTISNRSMWWYNTEAYAASVLLKHRGVL